MKSRADTIDRLLVKFEEIGINKQQLERFSGDNLETIDLEQYLQLRRVYQQLIDGKTQVGDVFNRELT